MMAGPGAVRSSQATVHATRKAHHHWVHLRWNAPTQSAEAVTGYNIYRSDDGGKTFRKVNRLRVAKTEYNDRSVRGGVSYIYFVKSVGNKGAESGPSNEIRLRVP
jgi:fibronectin type 3 domain-containing protein